MFAPAPFVKKNASVIALNAGDGQSATVSTAVAVAPSVLVTDGRSNPISGVPVTFAVTAGGGSVTSGSQTTNTSGVATVGSWTLGPAAGANTLQATSTGLSGSPVSFSATGTAAPKTVTYQASSAQTGNQDTWTFSAVGIGTANASRRVIVGFMGAGGNGGQTIVSVTIGGVAATVIVENNGGSLLTMAIAIAAVPTGTTADVVVVTSNNHLRAACSTWTTNDLSSSTAVGSGSSSGVNPVTATITSQNGGFCVGYVGQNAGVTDTWSVLTERIDSTTGGANYGGADAATSGASVAPSCTFSSGTSGAGVFASW